MAATLASSPRFKGDSTAFSTATVVTALGKALYTARVQTTPPATGSGTPHTIGGAAPKNIGMGVGATTSARTAVAADVALSQEKEARVAGTESITTTSVTGDTYQVVGTVTASATRAVDEAGLFDTVTTLQATATAAAAATSITATNASTTFATGGGTLYAANETTLSSSPQTITYSAISGSTITCTALTGAVNNGDWLAQGNMAVSATFAVINLASGDSIAFTWKIQQS